MTPALKGEEINEFKLEELIAFDVLGYDLDLTNGFGHQKYGELYQQAQMTVNQYDPFRSISRTDDVNAMIDASTIYEGRGSRKTRRRQELADFFNQ